MRRIYSCTLLFSCIAIAPGLAPAADYPDGFFINGGIGSARVDELPNDLSPSYERFDDESGAYYLNAGYHWGWFGVEAGYFDPSRFQTTQTIVFAPPYPNESFVVNGHVHGFTLGANAHYDLLPQWYVSGRAGLYHWHGSEQSFSGFNDIGTGLPIIVNNSATKTDWYAGAGFGYDFSPHFGMGVEYDYYRAASPGEVINLTTRVWSLNAEYRF